MADKDQLAILRQGPEVWNAWRQEHPDSKPDLRGANLTAANLRGAKLSRANLDGAKLSRANLDGADLGRANLSRADLGGAKLSRANLDGADLVGANLVGAELGGADLSRANLIGADLNGANLREAILFQANLGGAKLGGAFLFGANLGGAKLFQAKLIKANLSRANLRGADFGEADLSEAGLLEADLRGAKLIGTYLRGTYLRGTKFYATILSDLDLSSCKELESCLHFGPSIIDVRTLQRSGPLPLAFLRGVGLPDNLIEYLPSLLGQAIEFYSCFISYSSKDQAFAERLHADLQAKGVRCWFAPEDLKIGDPLEETIDRAIRLRDKLLLILSETSVASAWVLKEVRTALKEEEQHGRTVLFPVRIDAAVMDTTEQWAHDLRRTRHIGDFTRWKEHDAYGRGLERLLRDLKVEANIPPS